MKNSIRLIALTMALTTVMTVSLTACIKKSNEAPGSSSSGAVSQPGAPEVKELYIYSSKGETAEQFAELCKLYEEKTGIKVKSFSIGSGQDHMETLRAEMNSDISAQPAIFTIQGLKELIEWRDSGRVLNLNDVSDSAFKQLAEAIPQDLRLSSDGTNSFGIPYNVEGYGYIMDTKMFAGLMEGDLQTVYNDLVNCTYDEFATFVKAVDAYMKAPSAAKVTLSGTEHTFKAQKDDLTSKLTGVFAVAGAEKRTYGDHMLNIAISAVFPNEAAANAATPEQIDALKNPFIAFAKALELKTSHAAGSEGHMPRGKDFIVATTADYNATLQKFTDGKALFMKNGNWVTPQVEALNADVASRLTFVPIKLPLTQEDIKVNDLTVQQLNSTIPVYVPMYYAINAKKDEATIRAAEDFLVWLNTSDEGRDFIVNRFKFIPYNADPTSTTLTSALGNSILNYMKAGKVLSAPYNGAPANWGGNTVGLELMEKYLTKETWTETDYTAISDYAVAKWKEMQAQ